MESPLNIPQTLVRLCLRFYRPESFYAPKTANILRIMTSAKAVLRASTTNPQSDLETLIAEVAGRILKDLDRVRAGAKGFYQIGNRQEELEAIQHFARYYVEALFVGKFNADKSLLSSKRGIGLIEDTFEILTREELHKLGEQRKLEKESGKVSDTKIEADNRQMLLWSIEQTDEAEYLISNSAGVEIVIKDFDCSRAEESKLDVSELDVNSVTYPLELPTNYSSDGVWLEVTTVTDWDKFSSTLHVGSKVSMPIPFDFGKSLQSILKSPPSGQF